MIKDCHSFERRIQQLMDSRIDPETDEALWHHSAECTDCYQSLMACSLMHSEFLRDSDSMKIKLDTIGLQDLRIRKRPEKRRPAYFLAVVASLAAILLVSISLMPQPNIKGTTSPVAMNLSAPEKSSHSAEPVGDFQNALELSEIRAIAPEWSSIYPIRSFSVCLDWIQRSWRRGESVEREYGEIRNLRKELFYAETVLLAARR